MLKMYIGGTPGGTNGTEITSLTIKNLMSYMAGGDSNYPSYAIIPVCLREEAGYVATNVQIKSIGNNCRFGYETYSNWPTGDIDLLGGTLNVGTVGQKNKMVILFVQTASANIASGTELFRIGYVEDVA